jgi:hypothetical protein
MLRMPPGVVYRPVHGLNRSDTVEIAEHFSFVVTGSGNERALKRYVGGNRYDNSEYSNGVQAFSGPAAQSRLGGAQRRRIFAAAATSRELPPVRFELELGVVTGLRNDFAGETERRITFASRPSTEYQSFLLGEKLVFDKHLTERRVARVAPGFGEYRFAVGANEQPARSVAVIGNTDLSQLDVGERRDHYLLSDQEGVTFVPELDGIRTADYLVVSSGCREARCPKVTAICVLYIEK